MATNSYCVILPHFLDMKYPKMSKLLPILSGFRLRKHFRESQRLLLGVPVNAGYSITEGTAHPSAPAALGEIAFTAVERRAGQGFSGNKAARKGEPIPRIG